MIVILKFLNGDEVIGKAEEVGGRTTLTDPYLIETQVDRSGKVKATLYPTALYSADRKVFVNEQVLAYTSAPTEEILQMYEKQFQTIEVPEKKIIV